MGRLLLIAAATVTLLALLALFPSSLSVVHATAPAGAASSASPRPSVLHYPELVTSVYEYHVKTDQGEHNPTGSGSGSSASSSSSGRSSVFLDAECHLTLIGYEQSVDALDVATRNALAAGLLDNAGVDGIGVDGRVYLLQLDMHNTELYSIDAQQRRHTVDVAGLLPGVNASSRSLQDVLNKPFYFLQSLQRAGGRSAVPGRRAHGGGTVQERSTHSTTPPSPSHAHSHDQVHRPAALSLLPLPTSPVASCGIVTLCVFDCFFVCVC